MADNQVRTQQRQPATAQGGQDVAAPAEGAERTRTRPVYAPHTDIFETKDGLVILADMPGVSPDGADVTLERNVLTIRGRTEDSAPQGFSPVYLEYRPGDYERVFTLSEDIEAARIEAGVKNGVLRLFLPKAGPAQTKRIQVRAS
jgi:HSP20 family molecular chaperone IbpA